MSSGSRSLCKEKDSTVIKFMLLLKFNNDDKQNNAVEIDELANLKRNKW